MDNSYVFQAEIWHSPSNDVHIWHTYTMYACNGHMETLHLYCYSKRNNTNVILKGIIKLPF